MYVKKIIITLSINKIKKLTNTWFDYDLTEIQTKTIMKEVNRMCEEYGEIPQSELADIIGDVIYNN